MGVWLRVNQEKESFGVDEEEGEALERPLGDVGDDEKLFVLRVDMVTFDELIGLRRREPDSRCGVSVLDEADSVAHAGKGSKFLMGDFDPRPLLPEDFWFGNGRPNRIKCIKSISLPTGFAIRK